MERTLLSAAFDIDFEVDFEIKINPKIKGGGQECPPHTQTEMLLFFLFSTGSFHHV